MLRLFFRRLGIGLTKSITFPNGHNGAMFISYIFSCLSRLANTTLDKKRLGEHEGGLRNRLDEQED